MRSVCTNNRYDGKLLVLKDHDGHILAMDATLSPDGRTLMLGKIWQDQKITARFSRREA